jgi:hypothetical protein
MAQRGKVLRVILALLDEDNSQQFSSELWDWWNMVSLLLDIADGSTPESNSSKLSQKVSMTLRLRSLHMLERNHVYTWSARGVICVNGLLHN